jgi:hypothetical protein
MLEWESRRTSEALFQRMRLWNSACPPSVVPVPDLTKSVIASVQPVMVS